MIHNAGSGKEFDFKRLVSSVDIFSMLCCIGAAPFLFSSTSKEKYWGTNGCPAKSSFTNSSSFNSPRHQLVSFSLPMVLLLSLLKFLPQSVPAPCAGYM